jgi:SAM-dependent methyltransferase
MAGGTPLTVDFGRTASDYARHRPGFPDTFFDHARTLGIGLPGQRVLDLGTGTGTLARGFAERGCAAVGLDPSEPMLAQAALLAEGAGLSVRWVHGRAEETGLGEGEFDVVCAGTCWHWFDRARAASEALRVLKKGGRMLIAYFSYLPAAGTVGAATEEIVKAHNPNWPWAGHDGRHPWCLHDMVGAGLRHVSTFDFVLPVVFTHEEWRGRFRAHAGVVTLSAEAMSAFDADLARALAERFPEPVVCEHRVYGIVAEKP